MKTEIDDNVCLGVGLVALDVVLNGNPKTPPKFFAGGSCGNVMAILSFLGWRTFPIARLAKNKAAKLLISDLKKWNVNTRFIECNEEGSTPIIIHRIYKDNKGNPKHKFEFREPNTGKRFPSYKPVLQKKVESLVNISPKPKIFYFDRINRSSIELAKINSAKGAVVVFEPSSIKDEKLFAECLKVSHIVKFSHDRLPGYRSKFLASQTYLEIETMGNKGLFYRYYKTKSWKFVNACTVGSVIDTAGAGDWCTAGVVVKLAKHGEAKLKTANIEEIELALNYGQILGALSCTFQGARGLMYNLRQEEFERVVNNYQNNNEKILATYRDIKRERKSTLDSTSISALF